MNLAIMHGIIVIIKYNSKHEFVCSVAARNYLAIEHHAVIVKYKGSKTSTHCGVV